ncbi:transposase [Roseiflexus castenholzii]|uniref:transposase n=1 Tax=Roseiflexus castenholzii TaxID=120962 RepID=UPI003C7C3534
MKYDPQKHHRRSIRLKGYDYSQPGAYFITIVTQNRACLFGEVANGEMRLNEAGRMVHQEWANLPSRFPNLDLDAFIVMPNHIHGIIIITDVDPVGAGLVGAGLVPAQNGDGATISGATISGATISGATISGATTRVAPTVGDIVGAFKSITTVRYTHGVKHCGWLPFRGRLWQRNYYEHIIRDKGSLNRIRDYIVNNPLQWERDRENPTV